jgi:hypothetical protein
MHAKFKTVGQVLPSFQSIRFSRQSSRLGRVFDPDCLPLAPQETF